MKIFANSLFVIVIAIFMLMVDWVLYVGFNEVFMRDLSFSMYWGWFDWSTVFGWVPRIFTGFLAGICVVLLAYGEEKKHWALLAGAVMTVISYATTRSIWMVDPTFAVKVFYNIWPLMYIFGAFLGYLAREKLTSVNWKHH